MIKSFHFGINSSGEPAVDIIVDSSIDVKELDVKINEFFTSKDILNYQLISRDVINPIRTMMYYTYEPNDNEAQQAAMETMSEGEQT